jgi:glycosyltransferase involved in cell wall biosynthesis
VRIAFVLAGLGAGGAEKVVNLLARHRSELGDSIHVIALNAESPQSYFPYESSVAIKVLDKRPTMTGIGASMYRLLELRRHLVAIEPDLVVSFLTKVNVLSGLATIGLRTSAIMSERNNFMLQNMNPLWRLLAPIAAGRAATLVMQTSLARSALPRRLREKAAVIPNPVVLGDNVVRTPSSGITFIAVGRLEKQKGFDLLLEAFAKVAGQLPTSALVIFGEGSERRPLEQQAHALGIASRVRLPGVTKSPGEWLSAGDVFVLSSRFEGFPNVLLEALTAGMATVSFDCPWGPAEILHDESVGLLVPAGDVERLAEALQRVATDQQLRQKLSAYGPAAAARYSLAAIFGQWDKIIADAVPGGVNSRIPA